MTNEDLPLIEKKMDEIVKRDLPIVREEMDRDEAVKYFNSIGEHYKAEIIGSIPAGETISLYRQGDYVDLCRGPHVPSTGRLRVHKLMKLAGAYWRGDSKNEMLATISIDGATAEIFYANATGMIDLEVTIEGPGGHAWTACERVSAIHAAGLAIAEIAKIVPPKDPKTTLTVSLIEGGQAIHAIAQKAVFKINARSNSQAALNEIEEQIYHAIRRGVEIEQKKEGGEGELSLSIEKTLDVPAGSQPDDAAIIQLAKLATQAVGRNYKFLPGGCTNTNMSIERGIPAVTLGRGGEEYGTHTLKEWFNPKGVYACEQKSILMLSVLAGLDGVIAPLDKA